MKIKANTAGTPTKKAAPKGTTGDVGTAYRSEIEPPMPSRQKPFRVRKSSDFEEFHKFNVGAVESSPGFTGAGAIPERYGLNTLFLIARDPEWLFCYWDVDWHALAPQLGSAAVILRLYASHGGLVQDAVVNPHAPNWYLPVPRSGESYIAELGFNSPDGEWITIALSDPAPVPSKDIASPGEETFATVPIDVSFNHLLGLVSQAMREGETLAQALGRIQSETTQAAQNGNAEDWSDEQRKVLEALLGPEVVERIGLGSGEIERVLRRRLEQSISSESASGLSGHVPGGFARPVPMPEFAESSLFSGFGASWSGQPVTPPPRAREFFMHVNAEVIFYGGTHPDATVWINGEPVPLRPDGTFRYHFVFPDGAYEIPIVARSPDGVEHRSATLVFKRDTAREGEVGHTAQPEYLGPPMGQKPR
jgi:hypothetical protein